MDNGNSHERALEVYRALCANFDGRGWKYRGREEDLSLECGVSGDDLAIELKLNVDEKRDLLILLSRLPFRVDEEKRVDMAVAVSIVNNMLVDGFFDYDIKEGTLYFRMVACYRESTLGNELFTYLVMCSSSTIDEYNEKFMMLGTGMISIQQFLEKVSA